MHKTRKKPATAPEHILKNWSCTHFGDLSEIEAFIEASGKWETIASIYRTDDLDAEDIAAFIIQAIGEYIKTHNPETISSDIKRVII
jgi:hypothetical protein